MYRKKGRSTDPNHALAPGMGEGGVSWCYWILGVAFCGAYRTDALSPGHKTWYLNYALYGLPLSTPL